MNRNAKHGNNRRHDRRIDRQIPRTLFKLARPPQLTCTLRDRCLLAGEVPVGELVEATLAIITEGRARRNDRRLAAWLFRIALRAVCEAVVECGYLPLPLAVSLQTCWWKESPPVQPRLRLDQQGERLGTLLPTRPMRLVIRMDEPPTCAGELPLAQVLDAALDVLASGHHCPGDWRGQRWFFLQALRAVCEAVLDRGELPLPLSVSLHHRERGWRPPTGSTVRTSALPLLRVPGSLR